MEWCGLIGTPLRPVDGAAASGSAPNKSVSRIWSAVGHERARRIRGIWRLEPRLPQLPQQAEGAAPAIHCGNPGSMAESRTAAGRDAADRIRLHIADRLCRHVLEHEPPPASPSRLCGHKRSCNRPGADRDRAAAVYRSAGSNRRSQNC